MDPYDWSKELKDEQNKQPELPAEAAAPAEAEFTGQAGNDPAPVTEAAPEPEAAFESWAAPAAPQEPVSEPEPAAAYTARQAQPDYNNYYYSSGPAYTARPAQSGAPAYEQRSVQLPEKKTRKRSGGFWKKAVALALVCALLGGGAGFGGALLANRVTGTSSAAPSGSGTAVQVAAPRETTDLNVVTVESGKLMTANQVYKTNVNSTVGITTEIITTNFWGYQSTGAAAGSGFILTEDGYILTNQHVIASANSITVAMYDGKTYPAKLIGYDASNDIAVLKIDAKGLTPVTLGDSDALEVGDEVVAIGNPLGELTFSLTKGNVSALNRAVTLSSSVTMNLIQTDAAINSGNSGGALFNMYGEVVGITNAKYSSSGYSGEASIDNIGFAIPINSVREIVSSIIEKGYISTPYIGVSVSNVSEESQSYGMPQGAAIRAVEQGSPAEQAGLQTSDIITAVNGQTVTSFDELSKAISDARVGDELELTVYRRGETLKLTVTVGERIQDALADADQSDQSQQSGQSGQSGQDSQGSGSDPFGWGSNPFGWGTWPFG